MRLTVREWEIAGEICTDKQLRVLDLRRRGWSYRRCALFLDVDEATIRGHVQRAERRIALALERAETAA